MTYGNYSGSASPSNSLTETGIGGENPYSFKPISYGDMLKDPNTGANYSGYNTDLVKNMDLFKNTYKPNPIGTIEEEGSPWYKNSDLLGSYAGLASALTGIAGFGSHKDLLKTQTKGLKQNIAFAREEQERRNNNISGFNAFKEANQPKMSAFSKI